MERIKNIFHQKEVLLFAISRLFERMSYYGVRSLLLVYLIEKSFKMDRGDALSVYSMFLTTIIGSKIIGALFGDLVLGNRRLIIFGCILQSIGAFVLCIPSPFGLYGGLTLISLGSGFYAPNVFSTFGKLYLSKTKLMDAGFTIFYLVEQVPIVLGALGIGVFGFALSFKAGFTLAGISALLALIPVLLSKEKRIIKKAQKNLPTKARRVKMATGLAIVLVFSLIYYIGSYGIMNVKTGMIDRSLMDLPKSLIWNIESIYTLPISVIAIILWTYFYKSYYFKVIMGSFTAVISFGILLFMPMLSDDHATTLLIVSLFFLGVSDVLLAPVAHTIITRYFNPKYLAIIFSLGFIPNVFLNIMAGFIVSLPFSIDYDYPMVLVLATLAMFIFGIGLVVWINRKNILTDQNDDSFKCIDD